MGPVDWMKQNMMSAAVIGVCVVAFIILVGLDYGDVMSVCSSNSHVGLVMYALVLIVIPVGIVLYRNKGSSVASLPSQ